MRVLFTACVAAAIAVSVARPRAGGAPAPDDIVSLLTGAAHFTSDDVASVEAGHVVTKVDSSPENLEASVATAVKIATTKERTYAYFQQLVSYVDGSVTMAFGSLPAQPTDADLVKLTLEPGDRDSMKACQPTLCDMRVAGAKPTDIASAVNWLASDVTYRANLWVRQKLAAYAADYRTRGVAALAGHDDHGAAIDFAAMWRALFDRSPAIGAIAPGLQRYITSFPTAAPPPAADTIFWDKQHATGFQPIIGLTHQVTWRDPSQPNRIVDLQRKFYASHYVYGSLAVTLIAQDPNATPATTYVVHFNRARGDALKGAQQTAATGLRARLSNAAASVQRRVGETLVRESAEQLLSSMKEALEK